MHCMSSCTSFQRRPLSLSEVCWWLWDESHWFGSLGLSLTLSCFLSFFLTLSTEIPPLMTSNNSVKQAPACTITFLSCSSTLLYFQLWHNAQTINLGWAWFENQIDESWKTQSGDLFTHSLETSAVIDSQIVTSCIF